MHTYDIIYSIGEDCGCAGNLKKHSLRLCSGPFDWLTNAPFEKRTEIILNDFVGFINFEDFHKLSKDSNRVNDNNNDYYQNKRTGFYFYHDFPAECDFAQVFPIVKNKYERRIQRFLDVLKSDKKVLLVWFSKTTATPDDIILEQTSRICKKFNKIIDFLIIENNHIDTDEIIKVNLAENVVKYSISTDTSIEKYKTNGNPKTIKKVLCHYGLKGGLLFKIKQKLYYIFKKIITSLIPVKKLRKQVRLFMQQKYE